MPVRSARAKTAIVDLGPVVRKQSPKVVLAGVVKGGLAAENAQARVPDKQRQDECSLLPVEEVTRERTVVEEWVIDVMNVDEDAGRKARHELQVEPRHLRPGLHGVRRVDEEQVACLETLEERGRQLLRPDGDELDSRKLGQRLTREWLGYLDLARATAVRRVERRRTSHHS